MIPVPGIRGTGTRIPVAQRRQWLTLCSLPVLHTGSWGTDWGDNGIYMQLHKHENVSSDANVRNTWNNILQGISRGVTAVNGLKGNKDASAAKYIAEARGMIAYYNLLSR